MSKRRKEKKQKNNGKKILTCLIIVLLILGGYVVYNEFFNKSTTIKKPKVVDEIKAFDYVVNENDTKLFKTNFSELKKILSKKEVDKKAYAEAISKLFIIDFFTLDNKTSKNDVGGVQFVYSSYKTHFVDFARDSIYKQVNNRIDDKKTQNLPTVSKVEVSGIEEVDPTSIFETYDNEEGKTGYEVSINWEYKNNDSFQTKAVLTIVKDGNKLSIAKMEE